MQRLRPVANHQPRRSSSFCRASRTIDARLRLGERRAAPHIKHQLPTSRFCRCLPPRDRSDSSTGAGRLSNPAYQRMTTAGRLRPPPSALRLRLLAVPISFFSSRDRAFKAQTLFSRSCCSPPSCLGAGDYGCRRTGPARRQASAAIRGRGAVPDSEPRGAGDGRGGLALSGWTHVISRADGNNVCLIVFSQFIYFLFPPAVCFRFAFSKFLP